MTFEATTTPSHGGTVLCRKPMLRPLVLASASLLAASCIAPPPFQVERGDLVARANSHVAAKFIADEAEIWSELLRNHLPTSQSGHLELWQRDTIPVPPFGFDEPDFLAGYAPTNRIIVLRNRDTRLAHTIGHEMLHATLDESWSTLPAFLEEGLATALPVALRPVDSGVALASQMMLVIWITGEYSFEVEDERTHITITSGTTPVGERPALVDLANTTRFREMRGQDMDYGYSVGYFIAKRILDRGGLEGLHAMCLAAREAGHAEIPLEDILAAAELSEHAVHWLADITPLQDPDLEGEALTFIVKALRGTQSLFPIFITSGNPMLFRFTNINQTFNVDEDAMRRELKAAELLTP